MVCKTLDPKDACVGVREYRQGQFIERFHQHVPGHRVSVQDAWALLRALVLRYEGASAGQIVEAFAIRRGRAAKQPHPYHIWVEHSPPGCWTSYCGGNVLAWITRRVHLPPLDEIWKGHTKPTSTEDRGANPSGLSHGPEKRWL